MKKILSIAFLIISCSVFANENISKIYSENRSALGLRFSNISGYGISYTRRLFDNYAFLANGIVFYDEYVKGEKDSIIQDDKNIIYDYGFELQRDMFKSGSTRVYLLGGIYFSNETDKNQALQRVYNAETNLNEEKLLTYTDNEYDIVSGGIGLGINFVLRNSIALNVDFGYRMEHSEGKESGIPVKQNKTSIGLGIGVSYLY